MKNKKSHVVLSLSGGMDSSTLLLRCLNEYKNVTAISFDYGQKHKVELERAQSLVEYINENPNREYDFIDDEGDTIYCKKYNPVNYQIIKLDGLSSLLNSSLVDGGNEVPEGHYAQENMKETVVPNRNKIFSSISQAIALSIANKTGNTCDIALGIHSGDHAIYPDCRQEFRDADDHAFRVGNWEAEKVGYFTPYLEGDKFTILQDGEILCKKLLLNFDEVYSRTNTSYKPIYIEYPMGTTMEDMRNGPEGEWYSDYRSASSVERVEAFVKLGRKDPVGYANEEDGPVSWEVVKSHVEKVLADYSK
jgi:7-cyano-7-deazaguanine synthase